MGSLPILRARGRPFAVHAALSVFVGTVLALAPMHRSVAKADEAGTATVGDLSISAAWVRETPPGAPVAAGYLTIRNTGSAPDRLVGGSTPFAGRLSIHAMATVDGMMRMQPVPDGIVIAPGGSATLSPGGTHLMFTGLTDAPVAGGTVAVTLVFERAGTVEVTMPVAAIGAQGFAPGGHAN